MARKVLSAAFVLILTIFIGLVGGLVQNVAAGQPRWPGYLDIARREPWWSLLAILVVLLILGIPTLFKRGKPLDPPDGINLSGSTFNAPVSLVAGASQARAAETANAGSSGEADNSDGPAAGLSLVEPQLLPTPDDPPSTAERTQTRPVILYVISAFLDNGQWEETILAATLSVNPVALCLPLDERNLSLPNVAGVVVLFSAAQSVAVKKKLLVKLRLAIASYPSVRIILAAAGRTDEAFRVEDGLHLLRAAGSILDNSRFLVCMTEDACHAALSSHLRVAIGISEMQAIVEQSRSARIISPGNES